MRGVSTSSRRSEEVPGSGASRKKVDKAKQKVGCRMWA